MRKDSGLFLVLDGGEGCGKSTQAKILRERLLASGRWGGVNVFRDPGTTRIGEMIRGILLNPDNTEIAMRCEMLLYMAARAQMMSEVILPLLEKGEVVISDRFVSSTYSYQVGGEGLTQDDITAVGNIATQLRWPDMTIVLDMPVETAMERVRQRPAPPRGWKNDRIEARTFEYHVSVRQRFLDQASRWPEKYRVVRADQSVEDVAESIWKIVGGLKA